MKAAHRPTIYTELMTTRVTPEVLDAVQEACRTAGVKPCRWLRGVIDKALKGEASTRSLMAEVMALRTVLLTLQKPDWRGTDFTEEQLRAMVETADARRFAQADARILAGQNE